jgi:hypothetical protein
MLCKKKSKSAVSARSCAIISTFQNVIEYPPRKVKSVHSESIGDRQCGYRSNRSTIKIFCISQILEKNMNTMSTRNIKIMFQGSKVQRVRKADNLTAIYETII